MEVPRRYLAILGIALVVSYVFPLLAFLHLSGLPDCRVGQVRSVPLPANATITVHGDTLVVESGGVRLLFSAGSVCRVELHRADGGLVLRVYERAR